MAEQRKDGVGTAGIVTEEQLQRAAEEEVWYSSEESDSEEDDTEAIPSKQGSREASHIGAGHNRNFCSIILGEFHLI